MIALETRHIAHCNIVIPTPRRGEESFASIRARFLAALGMTGWAVYLNTEFIRRICATRVNFNIVIPTPRRGEESFACTRARFLAALGMTGYAVYFNPQYARQQIA